MEFTRDELLERVRLNDCKYFYDIYNDNWSSSRKNANDVKSIYSQNLGDGNEYTICLSFMKLDLLVLLEGTYSSWDSPEWDSVSFAEPFEFKEIRYKPVTLEYLRDKKIETVLKPDTKL